MNDDRKKIMVVFGTRPEAVKLAPVALALLDDRERFETYVLATGQHDEMMNQVLEVFRIKPDRNLGIMLAGQSLFDVTVRALRGIESALDEVRPDLVLVQGDTTTAFAAALAAYYRRIPVGHVEAGLRTFDKYNPFPEELNRRLITTLADLHFAPTALSARRLESEGVAGDRIFVTGNTVIDALRMSVRKDHVFQNGLLRSLDFEARPVVVLTMHRRESFGEPMRNILKAVLRLAAEHREVEVVFPVHFNPAVREAVRETLDGSKPGNLHLIDPLGYLEFVQVMDRSRLILTDSGGVQEEAPSLGKPVLVVRETTERPEGLEAGCARLVGTDPETIYRAAVELLGSPEAYRNMARAANPYGDGRATERILRVLRSWNPDGERDAAASADRIAPPLLEVPERGAGE